MDAVGVDVFLHVKAKTEDGIGMRDGISSAVRSLSKADGNDNPIVGYLSDVTNGLSDLFAVKDQDEIMNVKKPGYLTYNVMNKIMGLKPENSGGEFDIRPSVASNDELLFMILEGKAYEVLQKAHEEAINALKLGNKVSAPYQAALSMVENDALELVLNLTKSAGTGIGLEFHEEEEEQPKAKAEANGLEAFPSKTTLRFDNHEISKEELQRLHQVELTRQKNEEIARRLFGGGNGVGDKLSSAKMTID
ncbi:hypothetical protein EZV62_022551 [Acer yangbiense]|uniref:FACT complex subunit n=1 Tax=Acer yangbiense TaxID=1000413 RepID=A0A5C7HA05_9ROSI|nr:hypothetical protein EZV62_022551 [Acer yangbiense]